MASAKGSVEVTIRNELSQMTVVSQSFERISREFAIPEKTRMQLHIVLDEIVSNIIKYAWPKNGMHEFLVRINVEPDHVEIHTFDDGEPFDPRDAPIRDVPFPGVTPLPGGLGVQLVKKLVDQFD